MPQHEQVKVGDRVKGFYSNARNVTISFEGFVSGFGGFFTTIILFEPFVFSPDSPPRDSLGMRPDERRDWWKVADGPTLAPSEIAGTHNDVALTLEGVAKVKAFYASEVRP